MTFRMGVGALVLALASSCLCVSLEEIEKDSPSACSTEKPCAAGWRCATSGTCVKMTAGACNEGDTQPCGMDTGECELGEQVCKSGAFGACVGSIGPASEVCDQKDNDCDGPVDEDASDAPVCPLTQGVCMGKHAACGTTTCGAAQYGADYEVTESLCDGKDNDCNGMADNGLTQSCTEQRGECMSSRVSCTSGAFPACTPAVYLFNNPTNYEQYETKCDGRDNDCDGLVDAWNPSNVSNSATRSRAPVATTSSASPGNVIVLWEEEETAGSFKVRGRVVREDNTMSAIVAPSTTATAAARSANAAIASDGTEVVAAWSEEVTIGGAKRIALVSLNPTTGASLLAGGGALTPLSGGSVVQPTEVAVAVDAVANRVMLAVVDSSSLNLVTINMPLSAGQTPRTAMGVATGVQRARLAPAGGTNFWLTYENGLGQVVRCLVDDNLNRNCASQLPLAKSPGIGALTSSAPYGATSFFLQDVDAGYQRVFSSGCTDGGTCTMPSVVTLMNARADATALKVMATARNQAPTFLAWEEGNSTSASLRFLMTNRPADAGVRPNGPNPGHRPQPVFISATRAGLVFDSEGTSGAGISADEVYLSRFCF